MALVAELRQDHEDLVRRLAAELDVLSPAAAFPPTLTTVLPSRCSGVASPARTCCQASDFERPALLLRRVGHLVRDQARLGSRWGDGCRRSYLLLRAGCAAERDDGCRDQRQSERPHCDSAHVDTSGMCDPPRRVGITVPPTVTRANLHAIALGEKPGEPDSANFFPLGFERARSGAGACASANGPATHASSLAAWPI